jgi:hypothetical protein
VPLFIRRCFAGSYFLLAERSCRSFCSVLPRDPGICHLLDLLFTDDPNKLLLLPGAEQEFDRALLPAKMPAMSLLKAERHFIELESVRSVLGGITRLNRTPLSSPRSLRTSKQLPVNDDMCFVETSLTDTEQRLRRSATVFWTRTNHFKNGTLGRSLV